ncbi:MAG TPA: M23 family metallopeptidase [Flavisolibacter sp.]|jgi:murein DD-endopeptidase MepM/ murein hydrolase activator NlpD|nr:M23 family metallopeptidase [Flavisolibacter sp.]
MKKIPFLFLLVALYSFSCGSSIRNIFGTTTPHEEYAEKLDNRGLDKTPEGRAWLAASEAALKRPFTVSLPYRQQGFFHADKPRALGLQFTAKRGERLTFTLTRKGERLPIYADLFKAGETSSSLLSMDTSTASFSFDAGEAGDYVLRLQPELFHSVGYSLSVSVGPSLDFPVSGKANIGSIWGDARDGGKRSHEGIDIFAPKLTPAVAAADGFITGVREGGIGGKVVWLRPEGKNYTLYYAHLDQQLVQEGQRVKKGDVVGLVGNTGNARTTPPHLHFGIYGYGGAIDPLPFVNRKIKSAPAVADKKLTTQLKLKKAQKRADGSTITAATYLVPLATTVKGYLAEAPDGSLLQVPFSAVQVTAETVKKQDAVATTTPAAADKKS